ncbi:hypothetical protein AMATHDRAFT_67215 [Amanita thiersii Skay4041]|uniref:Uncharacterized protein n=1 Tax=Amanita thiersii Skay4041 TaxID=703135 RepID=A0A2A9N9M3_9AGAR|nr:hypothetical protein AMATHDRAFT_67215 [Amanita thiersii Skay4041]
MCSPSYISPHPHPGVQPQAIYTPDLAVRGANLGTGTPGSNIPVSYTGYPPAAPHYASAEDAHYWRNMFLELGYGGNSNPESSPTGVERSPPYSLDPGQHTTHQQTHHPHQVVYSQQMHSFGGH